MGNIRAIETLYKGHSFRSRIEARWAVFFDRLGIKWEYEKEGYNFSDVLLKEWKWDGDTGEEIETERRVYGSPLYLPDFWLSEVSLRSQRDNGVWFEVKGGYPDKHSQDVCIALGQQTLKPVLIAVDLPKQDDRWGWWAGEHIYQFYPGWDNCMIFMKCYNCGHVKIEFSEGSYMECPRCGGKADDEHPAITRALLAASSARFEHGEGP